LYNDVFDGVYANRLATGDPRCPAVVDVSGEWMAYGYHDVAPARALVERWRGYFSRARYVVFNGGEHPWNVPWNASLTRWFSHHFTEVHVGAVDIFRSRMSSGNR